MIQNEKKIAIVTAMAYNYGSRLQAYAMQQLFMMLGYDVEIVSFQLQKGTLKKWIRRIFDFLGVYPKISHRLCIRKQMKSCYKHCKDRNRLNKLRERLEKLDDFSQRLRMKCFWGEKQEMSCFASRYDVFVCGSDQIWKPTNNPGLLINLLMFVPLEIKKIAYAPSLGLDSIPEESKHIFREALARFDSVSAREISGVNALQELTPKRVELVLDPTLLIGRREWDRIIDESNVVTDIDYCFCYLLGDNPAHRMICDVVAKKLKLKIINLAHLKKIVDADDALSGDQVYDVSPNQFVGLIKRAKFVVTDSFHCSVFSLMYHTSFMTLMRFGDELESTNARLRSLLAQLNLDSRICMSETESEIESVIFSKIDFEQVDNLLEQKRIDSFAYLNKALGN